MTNRTADISLRQAARIAGLGYLAIFLFSSYTDFAGVVSGDATASANNILANEVLFRSGIASWLIVFIADVVVAWALYVLLIPVNRTLSLLAAWLRLIYTAMAGMFLLNLLIAVQLSKGADYLRVFTADQMQVQVKLFLNTWWDGTTLISWVFFGLHLFVLGYLILKSSYIPRVLGVLLIVASIGYLINSFAGVLLPNITAESRMVLIVPAIIAELALTLWLLFRGGKIDEMKS